MPDMSMPMRRRRFSGTPMTGVLMSMRGMRGMTRILTHFPLLVCTARFLPLNSFRSAFEASRDKKLTRLPRGLPSA